MTLQLEDLLSPKKIETEDSKVTNISILSVTEFKMQIKDEFIIEGLQKFDQYTQLNPITIQISDQNLKNKLFFILKIDRNIDLSLLVCNLVQQLKEKQIPFLLLITD